MAREKEKLEHRRKKLLEAHYCDAIPLDLMKSEQKEIAKKMAAIEHDIKMHNITFDEILANMESALELIEDCGKTYRAANESTKRMLNQSIFKRLKVYIDDDSDEVTVEPELAKPFDMMLEPVKADIPAINKSKLLGINKLSESIENAIRHSKEFFESGGLPHAIQTYQNNSNFFEPKSSSKDFLVDLSQLNSNLFLRIVKYKEENRGKLSTPVKTNISEAKAKNKYGETEVKKIRQKQKKLSEYEIQEVIKLYQNGVSANAIASSFGCHRRTISDVLKRNGVEVSHKASAKPELVKRVIELYAEMKTPKEVGAIVGIDCTTVREVLKDNGVYIRRSWEYPKK